MSEEFPWFSANASVNSALLNPYYSALVPKIPLGNGDAQRIGNEIQPMGFKTRVSLRLNEIPNKYQPIDIVAHVWYGFIRKLKGLSLGVASATAMGQAADHFLVMPGQRDGSGNIILNQGTTGFDGGQYSAMYPINKDMVQFKHKAIRLFKSFGKLNSEPNTDVSSVAVPPFSALKYFDLKFPVPKRMRFYDGTDVYPENYLPVVFIGYTCSGSTGVHECYPFGVNPLDVKLITQLWYKDA